MTEAVLFLAGLTAFGGLVALYDWLAERSHRKRHRGHA